MKLVLLAMGKTDAGPLQTLVDDFTTRLGRYIPFELLCVPDIRNRGAMDPARLRELEAAELLRRIGDRDQLWLLDEAGREYDSRGLAARIQKAMNAGPQRLVLVIGGAFGSGSDLRNRADAVVSLSKMTFNHQVVRLMAVEQLYRAFSILKGDPYHND